MSRQKPHPPRDKTAYENYIATKKDKNFKPVPGAGKGLEPPPWCRCHNRNPCPVGDAGQVPEDMYKK